MQVTEKNTPFILQFDAFGNDNTGYLYSSQVAEKLPFAIKRVFWVNQVPTTYMRGGHAGYITQEILVSIKGEIKVQTETATCTENFILNQPNIGLFIPAKCWITLSFSEDALLLCLASTDYDPSDYISDYATFKSVIY